MRYFQVQVEPDKKDELPAELQKEFVAHREIALTRVQQLLKLTETALDDLPRVLRERGITAILDEGTLFFPLEPK